MIKAWSLVTLACLAATIFACAGLQSQPASKVVPVSAFEGVASKWEGLSKRVPEMQDHAWVILIIRDNGHFNFLSNRADGFLLGTGMFHIEDGRLLGKTDTGTGTFTLHDKAGTPVLVGEVVLTDSHHYYLEMTPLK